VQGSLHYGGYVPQLNGGLKDSLPHAQVNGRFITTGQNPQAPR